MEKKDRGKASLFLLDLFHVVFLILPPLVLVRSGVGHDTYCILI